MHNLIDDFYNFLDKLGYLHPIHPAMTHMPIGLVVGACFLTWAAWLYFDRKYERVSGGNNGGIHSAKLMPSAYHMLVLAYIFYFPTVLFGIMDWQRYLAGAWLFAVKMKLFLAVVLFVLLTLGVVIGYRSAAKTGVMLTIYTLAFVNVTVLGFFGGQLVYTGQTPEGPAQYQEGAAVFDKNCSGCHAHGGNVITPNLPLRSAPQLDTPEHFTDFLRNPSRPDGSKGVMPPFPPASISDEKAKALYDYVLHVMAKPKR